MIILVFFIVHWYLSLFFQTFFLHRYSSHKMFTMSKFWERVFYILTFIFQGSSFLNPRAYAIMHRMHHTYSDTDKDPHSPHFFKDVFGMMWHTKAIYMDFVTERKKPENQFVGDYPVWEKFDKFTNTWWPRLAWAAFYIFFYIQFATSWWMFLLLPIHFIIGPIQGAIVNWCGHKYGYENYDNQDKSKNTLVFDFLMLGELFQNNHHKYPFSNNFAKRWFEIDPTYPIIKLLNLFKVIQLRS